jgi:activator of HSP90 ATPase
MSRQMTRRNFSARIVGGGIALGVTAMARDSGAAEEISRTAESIHQEVVIKATASRIYEALTDAKQFTKVTTYSPVMNAAPARIGRAEGDSFTLFGGHIVGRHVELVPSRRIVQAWRVVDWDAGVYSIARFNLIDRDRETTIVFDHIGFPNGKAEHLAEGWRLNYWEPLEKYFR